MRQLLPLFLLCSLASAEDLTTTDGKIYRGVTITKVEPDGLAIMHETGTAKVPFAKLSKEVQQKYGYDPHKALEYSKKRAEEIRKAEADFEAAMRKGALQAEMEKALNNFRDNFVDVVLVVNEVGKDALMGNAKIEGVTQESDVDLGYIRIVGPTRGKADGDTWRGRVWASGTYQYKDLSGGTRTVHCFYQSPEAAIERIKAQAAPAKKKKKGR